MKRAPSSFHLVTKYDLTEYPCGLCSGERVRVKQPIVLRDPSGNPTGKTHAAGEIWSVLPGVKTEPDVIWLRQGDGARHTWDAAAFFDTFERITQKGA